MKIMLCVEKVFLLPFKISFIYLIKEGVPVCGIPDMVRSRNKLLWHSIVNYYFLILYILTDLKIVVKSDFLYTIKFRQFLIEKN